MTPRKARARRRSPLVGPRGAAAGEAPRAKRPARLRLEVCDAARSRVDRRFLRRVVRATLAHADRLEMPVSLLLTTDAGIAVLHQEHLDDPTPTDVMSFLVDGGAEIVVSVDTARRVAREHGHTLRAELALYVVHGLLHLCGHDDVRAHDRRRMREAERLVMQRLRLDVHAVDA
ncbi:MAG: rRNA maturation RNase YbeY [Planctomycetes bacterium]|nr:rRNA maturation RNase YbeY [Planctomycetota bacterium]